MTNGNLIIKVAGVAPSRVTYAVIPLLFQSYVEETIIKDQARCLSLNVSILLFLLSRKKLSFYSNYGRNRKYDVLNSFTNC